MKPTRAFAVGLAAHLSAVTCTALAGSNSPFPSAANIVRARVKVKCPIAAHSMGVNSTLTSPFAALLAPALLVGAIIGRLPRREALHLPTADLHQCHGPLRRRQDAPPRFRTGP